jgi:hypothetical protein
MPWKERDRMDERMRIVARLLDGEKMAPLCRSFGISRKTVTGTIRNLCVRNGPGSGWRAP